MSTYRSRPVFGFPIDWATLPQSRIEYDLREVSVGFGTNLLYGEQTNVVRGWRFVVWGDDETGVRELEDFLDALTGRLVGFWLPTPEAAFQIVAGVNATSFKVGACGLSDWWEDHPCAYLWLTKDGEDPQAALITGVVDNEDGTETVTVAESVTVDETWQAHWLTYTRLADDVEASEFTAEGRQKHTFKVVELPSEYAAVESGALPVYLYHLWIDGDGDQVDWYWTSFAWDLDGVNGIDWLAKRITHKAITRSTRGADKLTIEVDRESPFSLLHPPTLAQPLHVEVKETTYDGLEAQTVIFRGRAVGASVDGRRMSVKCESLLDSETKCPAFLFSLRCNYRLYEPNTCRIDQASVQVSVTISAISGRTVTVAGAGLSGLAEDWFANGWIETGAGTEFDRKSVLASAAEAGGSVVLTLSHPLTWAEASDDALVVPGCDGTRSQCADKFSNFDNFGGHRVALKNLSLKAVDVPATGAGKK